MPRLSEFYGIVIYMYWEDHQPPHFHAIYGEHEALVTIGDGPFLRGGLPRTAARLVRVGADLHRDELKANWERAQVPEPLAAIEPFGSLISCRGLHAWSQWSILEGVNSA